MSSVLKMRRELSLPGICKTINRGRTYVSLRLSGHEEFTAREIEMIETAIERAKTDSKKKGKDTSENHDWRKNY